MALRKNLDVRRTFSVGFSSFAAAEPFFLLC